MLIIEDNRSMQKLLSKRLVDESYAVDSCFDGEEGLEYALQVAYDCILLDLMIPKIPGLEVLRKLRQNGNTSKILILTAKDSIEDRIKGLDAGADDYLIKPFSLDELLARIRALIRRKSENKTEIITLADLTVDTSTRTVIRDNQTIILTSKEYAIFEYLMRNKGYIMTRAQINEHVWDYSYYTESNVIDVYILYLRNKIDKGFEKKLIHTVRGFGYVMRLEDEKD
jgi:DNA-binding response OmpR family regulator